MLRPLRGARSARKLTCDRRPCHIVPVSVVCENCEKVEVKQHSFPFCPFHGT